MMGAKCLLAMTVIAIVCMLELFYTREKWSASPDVGLKNKMADTAYQRLRRSLRTEEDYASSDVSMSGGEGSGWSESGGEDFEERGNGSHAFSGSGESSMANDSYTSSENGYESGRTGSGTDEGKEMEESGNGDPTYSGSEASSEDDYVNTRGLQSGEHGIGDDMSMGTAHYEQLYDNGSAPVWAPSMEDRDDGSTMGAGTGGSGSAGYALGEDDVIQFPNGNFSAFGASSLSAGSSGNYDESEGNKPSREDCENLRRAAEGEGDDSGSRAGTGIDGASGKGEVVGGDCAQFVDGFTGVGNEYSRGDGGGDDEGSSSDLSGEGGGSDGGRIGGVSEAGNDGIKIGNAVARDPVNNPVRPAVNKLLSKESSSPTTLSASGHFVLGLAALLLYRKLA